MVQKGRGFGNGATLAVESAPGQGILLRIMGFLMGSGGPGRGAILLSSEVLD